MNSFYEVLDLAIKEIENVRKVLNRKKTKQVTATDELSLLKATAITWYRSHLPSIPKLSQTNNLVEVNNLYTEILNATDRSTARSTYFQRIRDLKSSLIQLRADVILDQTASENRTTDQPPDFSPLITDFHMQTILTNRWIECTRCIFAGAPLAAIVMMGGLLEALFLARINTLNEKAFIFKAQSAPRDKNNTTLNLKDWGLKNYIEVAHEVGWISKTAKDVSDVLRDYRNYVHPYKEFSHGAEVSPEDSIVLWEVTKTLAKQILSSVKT